MLGATRGLFAPARLPRCAVKVPAHPHLSISEHLVLRLVPKKKQRKKGVKWAEDVVDNEHLNKRKSKSEFEWRCCAAET